MGNNNKLSSSRTASSATDIVKRVSE